MIVKIVIDEVEYDVKEGENVLNICHKLGIFIPHLCYFKGLSPSGKCGLCVVELDGEKTALSCNLEAVSGLSIKTYSPKIQKIRKANIDKILKNHFIDCHICSKNGICYLQRVTSEIYKNESNFENIKGQFCKIFKVKSITENLKYDQSKCIYCERCLKFANEICGEDFKSPAELSKQSNNNLIENVIDVCPTAAIVQNDLNIKKSLIDSEKIETFDLTNIFTPEVSVYTNEKEILKISTKNHKWISDEFRFIYKTIQKRTINKNYNEIIQKLSEKIKENNMEKCVFIIGEDVDILSVFYIKYLQQHFENIIIAIEDFDVPLNMTKYFLKNASNLSISDCLIISKPNSISEIVNVTSEVKNLKEKIVLDFEELDLFFETNKNNNKIYSYFKPKLILFYNSFFEKQNVSETIENFVKKFYEVYNVEIEVLAIPKNISTISSTFFSEYIPLKKLLSEYNKHDLRFICQIGEVDCELPNKETLYVKSSYSNDNSDYCEFIPTKHFLEDSCFYLNAYGEFIKTKQAVLNDVKSNREFLHDIMKLVFEETFYDINEKIQNEIRNLNNSK